MNRNLYQPVTDQTVQQARAMVQSAKVAALATLDSQTNSPLCTRVSLGYIPLAVPLLFVSALAAHSKALEQNPACSLLIEEAGKGDPMNSPRLTLNGEVQLAEPEQRDDLKKLWMDQHPKAKLYINLPDFSFLTLKVTSATLVAGFGRASQLPPEVFG